MTGKRIVIVFLGVLIFFGVLVYNLFKIQVSDHLEYVHKAEKQQTEQEIVPAERGIIKDRRGVVLAYTSEDISVFVDKRMLDKYSDSKNNKYLKVDTLLAGIFNKPKGYYSKKIKDGKGNVLLEKKVSKANETKVKAIREDALFVQNDFTRIYPYGSLASHVLGYVDYSLKGQTGIEKNYEDFLKGKDGKQKLEKDGNRKTIAVDEDLSVDCIPGSDIYLTINKIYQKILEEELIKGLKEYGAESSVGIIMNPKTGEILSLSNLPNYDPYNYSLFDDNARRDRALTDTYEPGSTIKPIIMSILLQENAVNENDIVNTENGEYTVARTRIRDTHRFAKLTVREVIEHSSNIGMSKIIQKIDNSTLYKYLRDFGFGNPTSIDLPGEADGTLKRPENFGSLTKTFISFGYQLSVTPVQLITAFSAIINGGHLVHPFIVRKVVDSKGNTIKENHPLQIRNVIDQVTSERIRSLMVGVVEEGTGTLARLDDMFVGGKTGTAQLLINGSYSHNQYNSSFIGYFPAENPEILMLILYTAPEKERYGGRVAAPVFKRVAQRIIDADIKLSSQKKKIDRQNEAIQEFNIALNDDNANKDYIAFNNIGEETDTEAREFAPRTTMPNLKNKSVRDAIAQITSLGLNYELKGKSGRVVYQSIPVGSKIEPGNVCIIKCEKSKNDIGIKLN